MSIIKPDKAENAHVWGQRCQSKHGLRDPFADSKGLGTHWLSASYGFSLSGFLQIFLLPHFHWTSILSQDIMLHPPVLCGHKLPLFALRSTVLWHQAKQSSKLWIHSLVPFPAPSPETLPWVSQIPQLSPLLWIYFFSSLDTWILSLLFNM
jgi:hypothetical protein